MFVSLLCRFIPQRWLLYIATVPHIMYLLSQMSDYTTSQWLKLVGQNILMLSAGGLGTIPWIGRPYKGKMVGCTMLGWFRTGGNT